MGNAVLLTDRHCLINFREVGFPEISAIQPRLTHYRKKVEASLFLWSTIAEDLGTSVPNVTQIVYRRANERATIFMVWVGKMVRWDAGSFDGALTRIRLSNRKRRIACLSFTDTMKK